MPSDDTLLYTTHMGALSQMNAETLQRVSAFGLHFGCTTHGCSIQTLLYCQILQLL